MNRSSSPAPFGGMPRSQPCSTASTSKIKAMYRSGETFIDHRFPISLSSDDSLSLTPGLRSAGGSKKRHFSATQSSSTHSAIQTRRTVSNSMLDEGRLAADVASRRGMSEHIPRSSSPLLASSHQTRKSHTLSDQSLQSQSHRSRVRTSTSRLTSRHTAENRALQYQKPRVSFALESEDDLEPPTKRRRGMTSILVDGALTAAVITGAAAVTAVSLWSRWRKTDDSDDSKENDIDESSLTKSTVGILQRSPPPPYFDHFAPFTPVSRPALRAISSNRDHLRQRRLSTQRLYSPLGLPSLPNGAGQDPPFIKAGFYQSSDTSCKVGEEDDETFERMQKQTERLITEGKEALHSTPILNESEIQRQLRSDTSFSTPSRIPKDQISTYDFLRHY